MPRYARRVRIETNFDEQDITVVLKPMRYEDALMLRGLKGEEAIKIYAERFPSYVASMTPVRDADGEEVPIEEIATALFYTPLIGIILGHHVEAGQLQNPSRPVASSSDSSAASQ